MMRMRYGRWCIWHVLFIVWDNAMCVPRHSSFEDVQLIRLVIPGEIGWVRTNFIATRKQFTKYVYAMV